MITPARQAGRRCAQPNYAYFSAKADSRRKYWRRWLYSEYEGACRAAGERPYSFSSFCRGLAAWRKESASVETDEWKAAECLITYWSRVGRGVHERFLFVAQLAFSDRTFCCSAPDRRPATWERCCERAYRWLGGVPFVTVYPGSDVADGTIMSLQDFAAHHRTVLYCARPKQARTAARSARPMDAKSRSAVADRVRADIGDGDFADVEELDAAILERAEHYNAQPCGGGPSRNDLFWEQEAAMLLALPFERYGSPEWLRRVAGGDYHVKVHGFRYSVPWGYAGQCVNVRVSGEAVEVWSGGAMIARHARVTEQVGRNTVTDPAHRPPSHAAFAKRMETRFMAMAAPMGKWAAKAMKLVLRQCGKGGMGFRACKEFLDLADAPSGVILDDACRSVLQGEGAFSVDAVRGLIGAGI